MIDVIKQTPAEYSKQSRDYQILARLYSAIFNVSKLYADDMSIWDNDIDNKLAYLRANTLNFDIKHQWDLNDLEAITSGFKYIMKLKGTAAAIEYCVNILMKVRKIYRENVGIKTVVVSNNKITIRIEENLMNVGIVEDLMKHLIPAGMTYRIIPYKAANLGDDVIYTQILPVNSSVSTKDVNMSTVTKNIAVGDNSYSRTYIYDEEDYTRWGGK